MIDLLEKDKEHILTELTGAFLPEKAVRILEKESEKLLLKHNEICDSEREREAAAGMMQTVRLSLPLIDSTGTVKVWEHGDAKVSGRRFSITALLAMTVSVALLAFGIVPLVMSNLAELQSQPYTDLLSRGASVIGGIALAFLAGSVYSRPAASKASKEQQVEIHIDPDKIYRYYRAAILSVDRRLEELRAAERWSKREQAGNIDGRPAMTSEIELFSDLIAAAYSGDPEYALEKIDDVRYYLHKQQIEIVDYSEETKQFFDLMPGTKAGTIRPALVADGELLKKGLASSGK